MRPSTLVRSLVLAMLLSSHALAQVSPGRLSAPHADLEGLRHCMQCHGGRTSSVDDRCLDCHKGIASLRDAKRGLHAHVGAEACAKCHPEHGGEDMSIVRWTDGAGRPEDFDHGRTGWDLTGKHAGTDCRECHRPDHQAAAVMALRPGGRPGTSWLGMETSCVSCHADPHEGRLGTACADCHTTNGFKEIRKDRFDHGRTEFPLQGAHAKVACEACHGTAKTGWKRPEFRTCNACHADPHQGRATIGGRAADCGACHGVESFTPSTFTVARHRDTAYPLLGKHRTVACSGCHGKAPAKGSARAAAAAFRFHPDFRRCRGCHGDAHGGQLAKRPDGGTCEACHGVDGFSPSTVAAADHRRFSIPLEGAHAKAACRACHGPDRPGLPAFPRSAAVGSAGVLFRLGKQDCAACHRDPHEGRFAPDGERPHSGCLDCHGYDSFRTSSVGVEMHARFAFPLQGAHASVPCIECHRDLDRKPAATTLLLTAPRRNLTFETPHARCADCHADPHGGQFGSGRAEEDCGKCHGLDAFVPAVAFDHDRDARFPLEAAHAKVACAGCHASGRLPDGTTGIVYRPVAHRCEDCHARSSPDRGSSR